MRGEALFAKNQFKIRCRICVKIEYKGVDFLFNSKKKIWEYPMWAASKNHFVPIKAV